MSSPVALVEDEKEKASALLEELAANGIGKEKVDVFANVRDAVLAVRNHDYKLIILDVSLPTFAPSGMSGSAGRAQQQSGGLEVLRALGDIGKQPKVIVITQYPDILFGDESIKLEEVCEYAMQRYEQSVLQAILYRQSDNQAWQNKLKQALRDGQCKF